LDLKKNFEKNQKNFAEIKMALTFATPIKTGRQKKPKDLWEFGSNST